MRPGFDPQVRKIPWRRKWQPTPVSLSGKSHGWRSLVGYSPWGHKESDTTKRWHTLMVLWSTRKGPTPRERKNKWAKIILDNLVPTNRRKSNVLPSLKHILVIFIKQKKIIFKKLGGVYKLKLGACILIIWKYNSDVTKSLCINHRPERKNKLEIHISYSSTNSRVWPIVSIFLT